MSRISLLLILPILSALVAGALSAAQAATSTATAPRLAAEVSWIGNSWSGKSGWVPQDVDDLYVSPEGDILTAIPWEEGGGNVTRFDSTGAYIGRAHHTHGWGMEGGEAVCANASYIFLACQTGNEGGGLVDAATWPAKGLGWWGISRRKRADLGAAASFPGGKGGKGDTLAGTFLVVAELPDKEMGSEALRGLVASASELFVSLRRQGRILVYDAETMQQKRTFALPRADRLALATGGRLWALQGPEQAGGAWLLLGLDAATGGEQARFACPDDWLPSDLAFTPDGKLLIADAGPDQQIQVLDGLAAGRPRLQGAIGVKGGVFAGPVPGATGPLRFNRPRGVGCDGAGNIYVASDGATAGGGTVLESYTGTLERRWFRLGLHFVDLPDLDPRTMTIYTKEEIYTIDLSKPSGEQWTYRAYTCDPRRYPDDARVHGGHSNAWVRELGGKPFLFTTGMTTPDLAVYRFDQATAGEIAIPCALFSRDGGKAWPAAAPRKGGWRWQDQNGDGAMQAGEFSPLERDGNNVQGMFPLHPDLSGRIWWGFGDELRAYAFTGLSPGGLPQWDWAKPFIFKRPPEFDEMRRANYDVEHDLLVVGGNKGAAKHQHWKPMGPVLAAYDHALHGTPTLRWTVTLPLDDGASGHESHEPIGFDLAGDYCFVPYTRGLAADALHNAFVKVLRLSDGRCAGNLAAEDALGEIGLLDLEYSANARHLADGRYVVLLEEDCRAKTIMFVWKPAANGSP